MYACRSDHEATNINIDIALSRVNQVHVRCKKNVANAKNDWAFGLVKFKVSSNLYSLTETQ